MAASILPRQVFGRPDLLSTATLLVTATAPALSQPSDSSAGSTTSSSAPAMTTIADNPLDPVVLITNLTANAAEPAGFAGGGEDMGPLLNYTVWIMTGVSLTILALRLYCKATRSRKLWWDDYVLTLAWLCLAVAAAMTSVSVSLGYGRPLDTITAADLSIMPRFANVAGFFSVMAAMWSKVSFGLTLARISDGWILRFIWAIIVTMTLVMGSSAVLIEIEIPVDLRVRYFFFASAYSGLMDITLSILPWKIIWSLRMTRKEKAGVLIAMSMGVFAGATSFIKASRVPSLASNDPVASVQLVIFGIAEGATTIIAASIPVLRALIREGKGQPPRAVELNPISSKVPLRRVSTAASDYTTGNGSQV